MLTTCFTVIPNFILFWVGGSCWDARTLLIRSRTDLHWSKRRHSTHDACASDDGSVACDFTWLLYSSFACIRLIRGYPATPSVELGTLRRTQHAGHATLDFPAPWIAIDQCEDGGAHGISSMAYRIGQPDRLSTNIFAVTWVGLGGHRVECVACSASERRKR